MSENPEPRFDATPDGERAGGGPPMELTTDELFHTLQCERRRLVLQHLLDRAGPTDLESLAESVAASEHDTAVAELSEEQLQRTSLDLYQSHLPKLDALDLIAYDQSREVVEPTTAIDLLEPYLDGAGGLGSGDIAESVDTAESADTEDTGRNWARYYVGTSLTSLALVAVAFLGTLSPVVLSFELVAGLVTAMHVAVTAGIVLSTDV